MRAFLTLSLVLYLTHYYLLRPANGAIGHSERRTLFHETSEIVAQKTRAALDSGLSIILCIGETLKEREAGETAAVTKAQLKPIVEALKESDWT